MCIGVCVHTCMSVCAGTGRCVWSGLSYPSSPACSSPLLDNSLASKLNMLSFCICLKHPSGISEFNTVVGSRLFFQYRKHLLIIHYNLMGTPCYMWSVFATFTTVHHRTAFCLPRPPGSSQQKPELSLRQNAHVQISK